MPSTHFSNVVNSGTNDDTLQLPSLSAAPTSPVVGDMYYNTTTKKAYIYQDSGWTTTDGSAAGSLEAAYTGGQTIAVDDANLLLNLSDASNDYCLELDSTSASGTLNDMLLFSTTGAAVVTDAIDVSDSGITNSINVGGNIIIGTTATINFTNFDVDGTGNVTAGGTLTSTGAATLSNTLDVTGAITNASTITSQGYVLIDVDNAEAFLVRENGDAADVFVIDTTQDAGDTTVTVESKTTTGKALYVDADTTTGQALDINAQTVTTGDALRIVVDSAIMEASGAAISVLDGSTEIFAVRDDGSTFSIKGTAEGTTAVGVTTGDILISDGDLNLSSGEISVTTDAAGDILTLENSEAGATGVVLKTNHNSASPADDDIAYEVDHYADDDGGTSTLIAKQVVTQLDVTAASDDAEISWHTMIAGTLTEALVINNAAGGTVDFLLPIALTGTGNDQWKVAYDGSNYYTVDVDSDGSTTLTSTGTNADFEIASGTAGDITLDSTGDIILEAGGGDVNSDSPLNITVAAGSQLELIAAGSIKCVDSVANTTGATTRTCSGGSGSTYEVVAAGITLDSSVAIALESTGVTSDAELKITQAAGSQLELIASGSIKCVDSVTDTTGATTRTISGGTANTYEIVATDITLDSGAAIALESTGVTSDAGITVTKTSGSLFSANYDGSNYFKTEVASDGGTTLTTVGTDADFEIATGTTGSITLDATAGIALESTGVTSNAAVEITASGGSQLTLINNAALQAVMSVAATTADTTLTVSGGTTNVFEVAADAITLDSAGALALESTGVSCNAELIITQAAGSQLELVASGSIKCVDSVADTTGATTRTCSGGSGSTYEVVAAGITLDSSAAIALESTGVTCDAEIAITQAAGSQLELIGSGSIKSVFSTVDTTGNTTISVSGGSGNTFEVEATGITLDSGAAIALESTGLTSDADLTITDTTGPQLSVNYDGSNQLTVTVSVDGATAIAATGTDPDLSFTTSASNADITFDPHGTGDVIVSAANFIVDAAGVDIRALTVASDPTTNHTVGIFTSSAMADNKALMTLEHDTGVSASGSNILRIVETATPNTGAIAFEMAVNEDMQAILVNSAAAAGSSVLFSGAGALVADKAVLEVVSNAVLNADAVVARLEQTNVGGVGSVLLLKQDDISECFMDFESTEGSENAIDATQTTPGTVHGSIAIKINGVKKRIPVYDDDWS